ncbi:MAG: hypothetical protein AB7H92_17640 [Microbacteriaceae bacterium]
MPERSVRDRLADVERRASIGGAGGAEVVDAALLAEAVRCLAEFGVVPSASQRHTLAWLCRDGADAIADVVELVAAGRRGT